MQDIYDGGKLGAVRNKDGFWINSQVFRESALYFEKHGSYDSEPWGSPDWYSYWERERDRCLNGVTIGGAKITGNHYSYLNYRNIQAVDLKKAKSSKVATKIARFPDFWDGDYNYFWAREIARNGVVIALNKETEFNSLIFKNDKEKHKYYNKLFNSLHLEFELEPENMEGGWNLVVGKGRRKGYSFKNASVGVDNFYFRPDSQTIYNAYDKKFLTTDAIFNMVHKFINYVNNNTAWRTPSDAVNKIDSIKNSYYTYKGGGRVEEGLESTLMAISAKDNPDVNRGKSAYDVLVEESGSFGNPGLLIDLINATVDTVSSGEYKSGMITVFGTSGSLDKYSADYAKIFSNPFLYDFLPFVNIWDKNPINKHCGFFHPMQLNREGFYDSQGNSDTKGALESENKHIESLIAKGTSSKNIVSRKQENPTCPEDAFGSISVNVFDTESIKNRISYIRSNNIDKIQGLPVALTLNEGIPGFNVILDGSKVPIMGLNDSVVDPEGCPVIYEEPVPNAPPNLYKIGYDPYRQDEGSSYAGIVVYKGKHRHTTTHSNIVAEYVGRMNSPDDVDRIALIFALLYNTKIMYENEVTGVKTYFSRRKYLHLLAPQPDSVINANVKKSKVARVYGCHMVEKLKDAGERYTKMWLEEVIDHDSEGRPITVIDRIPSLRILEELKSYNRKGNFDAVSALFMCMFQIEEEELEVIYGSGVEHNTAKYLSEQEF